MPVSLSEKGDPSSTANRFQCINAWSQLSSCGWPLQAFIHEFYIFSVEIVPFPNYILDFLLLDFNLHVFVSYLFHVPCRDLCLSSLLGHVHLCASAIIDGLIWR